MAGVDGVPEFPEEEEKEVHTNPVLETVRADHDYIDLLVDVNDDSTISESACPCPSLTNNNGDLFNLHQLAEVSLAEEGKLVDEDLAAKIHQVRSQQHEINLIKSHTDNMLLPSSKRTMKIVLPDNASHIIICSKGNPREQRVLDLAQVTSSSNAHEDETQEFLSDSPTSPSPVYPSSPSDFVCTDCGKKYSTSSNLARHRQTHRVTLSFPKPNAQCRFNYIFFYCVNRSLSDKKAKSCPHCSKVYVSMPAFAMHLRTHNQTCRCHICGKSFSRPWLLQGHIRTHTGERPYECEVCHKAFADKSNLRAHTQTHSTKKPFTCEKCGKTFALKSYLCKHEESSCIGKPQINTS
eukprot:maker-scaffold1268_size51707-snap-gene-0.17 protein:Tk07215 transcript:maker-scaffold1268_size51707-snap-gene-0.17-mRNA-1 annotation:"transcriptional repressor scratch"